MMSRDSKGAVRQYGRLS